MKHKNWSFLQSGDIIDVISPGYPSPAAEVAGGIAYLQSKGFVPRLPLQLTKKHFLHSNSDEARFEHLQAALLAKDSRAIWCTRGGYGSNRLLPLLAKIKKAPEPKLLLGLSDVTSLHCFLTQEWGWPTLHACVLDRLGRGHLPKDLEKELWQVLQGEKLHVTFKKLKPLNASAQKTLRIHSSVVGGNLTVLQSTLGTPYQIHTAGSLLFVEDIGERGYRIDRIFEQFRQAGLFAKCKGILLGQFIGGVEPQTQKDNFKLVFKRWAQDLDIPIWSGVEAGHGDRQRTLPLNTPCELLKVDSSFSLVVESGGVLGRRRA